MTDSPDNKVTRIEGRFKGDDTDESFHDDMMSPEEERLGRDAIVKHLDRRVEQEGDGPDDAA